MFVLCKNGKREVDANFYCRTADQNQAIFSHKVFLQECKADVVWRQQCRKISNGSLVLLPQLRV